MYDYAKTIYDKFLLSNKKYVCLEGKRYDFLDSYDRKFDLCANDFNAILGYLKIQELNPEIRPVLLSKLAYAGAMEVEVNPPLSLFNNAVYIYLGKVLRLDNHVVIKKTTTGYNDDGKGVITFEAYDDLNPMNIESISWCAHLVFTYNKKFDCGVYGVFVT